MSSLELVALGAKPERDCETLLMQLLGILLPGKCWPGAAPGTHPAGIRDGLDCHAMGTKIGIWVVVPGITKLLKSPPTSACVGTVTAPCPKACRYLSRLMNQKVLSFPW